MFAFAVNFVVRSFKNNYFSNGEQLCNMFFTRQKNRNEYLDFKKTNVIPIQTYMLSRAPCTWLRFIFEALFTINDGTE